MDLILLISLVTALLVILLTLLYLKKKNAGEAEIKPEEQPAVPVVRRPVREVQRRAARQLFSNVRNEVNAAADAPNENQNASQNFKVNPILDEKMGAKKRAKLEAKEQKRAQREQEIISREERKVTESKLEEERKKQEKIEEDLERKKEEEERLAREAQERKELEEYLNLKKAFSVEEEGFDQIAEDDEANQLANFIQYIKNNKVIILEDLANEFKMKTQHAIDRVKELQANGSITGVIDDRGKFIYISEEELLAVSKFIKQRGRVSISELAECSNTLINLKPLQST